MKVFYCRNCGFFHTWGEEKSKEDFRQDHEGFSRESMKKIERLHSDKMEIHCPVCPCKGLLSVHGATVQYELTAGKQNFLIVRKFYYMETKR